MSSICRNQIAILRNYALYCSNTGSVPILPHLGVRLVYFLSQILSKTTLRMGSWLDCLCHSKSANTCITRCASLQGNLQPCYTSCSCAELVHQLCSRCQHTTAGTARQLCWQCLHLLVMRYAAPLTIRIDTGMSAWCSILMRNSSKLKS